MARHRCRAGGGLSRQFIRARGHGDSEWSADGDYTDDDLVAGLRRVMDDVGATRPALVEASMGGATSLIAMVSHTSRRLDLFSPPSRLASNLNESTRFIPSGRGGPMATNRWRRSRKESTRISRTDGARTTLEVGRRTFADVRTAATTGTGIRGSWWVSANSTRTQRGSALAAFV